MAVVGTISLPGDKSISHRALMIASISKSKSNAQILFLDQTVLTLGEETELTIDEFVYDPIFFF